MSGGAPGTQQVAVEQHAAGDAHAWNACTSCKAERGEQCYSLANRLNTDRALGRPPRKRKRRPCAGRVWVPRKADT